MIVLKITEKLSNHEGISNFPQNRVKIWLKNQAKNAAGGWGGKGAKYLDLRGRRLKLSYLFPWEKFNF